jgi:hypothetical protein
MVSLTYLIGAAAVVATVGAATGWPAAPVFVALCLCAFGLRGSLRHRTVLAATVCWVALNSAITLMGLTRWRGTGQWNPTVLTWLGFVGFAALGVVLLWVSRNQRATSRTGGTGIRSAACALGVVAGLAVLAGQLGGSFWR